MISVPAINEVRLVVLQGAIAGCSDVDDSPCHCVRGGQRNGAILENGLIIVANVIHNDVGPFPVEGIIGQPED